MTPGQLLHALGKQLGAPLLTEGRFRRLLGPPSLAPAEPFVPGRILHCSPTMGSGGSERQTRNTLLGLVALGHTDCLLLCRTLRGQANRFYLDLLEQKGIAAFGLEEVLTAYAPPGDHALALRRRLRSLPWPYSREILHYAMAFAVLRPSVVHIWQDMPLTAMAARLVGVPRVVLSWRSLSPPHFDYNHAYFRPAYRVLIDQPGINLLNNSEAGRDDYASWLGIAPDRIRVVRNGVDSAFLQRPDAAAVDRLRARLGIPADAPVVGSIFRLSREKDPWLWLQTARELAEELLACHFVVFGDGPLRQKFETAVREAGLADRFHLPGRTAEAATALGLFDIFLLCSKTEGTPNVLIEAQGLGVPVVTLAAGGTSETVLHGQSGFVVRERDPCRCSEAIRFILENATWREQAARTARAFVADQFGLDRMLSETLAVYGEEVCPARG